MKRILIIICFLVFYSVSAYAGGVILNIWDGAEYANIKRVYNNGNLPNLQSIGELKHLTCNTDFEMLTQTRPQHATMLTGYLADVHGVYSNENYQTVPLGLTVYEQALELNQYLKTAHIVSKPNIEESLFGNILGIVDIFTFFDRNHSLKEVTSYTINLISIWQNEDFLIVCHFREPDEIGHVYGIDSLEYRNQLIRNDVQLGRLLDALPGETVIIVLGDHGFGCPTVKNHKCSPNTFIVSNVSIPDNLFEIDVTPLILQLINSY